MAQSDIKVRLRFQTRYQETDTQLHTFMGILRERIENSSRDYKERIYKKVGPIFLKYIENAIEETRTTPRELNDRSQRLAESFYYEIRAGELKINNRPTDYSNIHESASGAIIKPKNVRYFRFTWIAKNLKFLVFTPGHFPTREDLWADVTVTQVHRKGYRFFTRATKNFQRDGVLKRIIKETPFELDDE